MNRWFWAWLVAISSLVVAFFIAPAAQANATGTITGVVTDSGGHGIQGVVAELFSVPNPPATGSSSLIAQATTSATGSYHVSAPAGEYFLCFDGRNGTRTGANGGYLSECTGPSPWDNDPTDVFSQPISIAGATTTPGYDIRLASGAAISGTVTAASGGAGLSGVLVGVYRYGQQLGSATTAADGTYYIGGLTPNLVVNVCFLADNAAGGTTTTGYTSQCYNNVPWQGYHDMPPASTTVTTLAGQNVSGINAALAAGSQISGQITDGAAHGVAGVKVYAYTLADGNLATGLGSATTDSSGNYTVTGLAASAAGYDLCYDSSGATGGNSTTGYLDECYHDISWDPNLEMPNATPVPVGAGSTASGIDQALSPAGAIAGTVTANGVGIGNVTVQVSGPSGISTATTAANGTYQVSGLIPAASAYTVCFNASKATGGGSPTGYLSQCYNGKFWDTSDPVNGTTAVSVTGGSTTSGINAALVRGGGISGTVTAGGVGVQDVTVLVYSVSSGNLATGYSTVSTAADGSYTVKGLKPGTNAYRVCFDTTVASGGPSSTGYNDQCYNDVAWDGFTAPTSDTVSVATSTVTPSINASLTTAGAISGHVTSAAAGTGIGGVSVLIVPISDLATSTGFASAVTAPDGSYTVRRLPASADGYAVCFDAAVASGGGSSTGYQDQCANGQPWDGIIGDFPLSAAGIPVTAGATSTADGSLTAAGAIAGKTTEVGSGAPLVGVNVTLYNDGNQLSAGAQTASDGTYRINGLAPSDTYTVCFDTSSAVGGSPAGHQDQCYKNQPWDGFDPPANPTLVSVSAGSATTGISASFKAGAGISGTVTGIGSEPLQFASISIYDSARNFVESVQTDNGGHYLASALTASTRGYYVCADGTGDETAASPAGYLKECYNNIPQSSFTVPAGSTKIPLAAGQIATADFSLPAASGISGTVTSGTTPLGGVNVDVFDSHGRQLAGASTADDGTYLVGGLAPSTTGYYVCFDGSFVTGGPSSSGYLGTCWKTKPWVPNTQPAGNRVPVPSGTIVPNINVKLGAAAALSGKLSGGGPNLFGTVYVYDQAGNPAGQGYINNDGTFQVQGLAATASGDIVCFQVADSGFVNDCYQNVPWDQFDVPAGAQPVVLTAGSTTTGINETLQKTGTVVGKVTSQATGNPVTKVDVYLETLDGSQGFQANVNSAGSYSFTGVTPGSYDVCVQPRPTTPGGPYAATCYTSAPWDGSFPVTGATTVTVGSGQRVSAINVALPGAA